jgi:uncharacterized RDD family membrane protein YckC
MNVPILCKLTALSLLLAAMVAHADGPAAPAGEDAASSASASGAQSMNEAEDGGWRHDARRHHHPHGNDVFKIGEDSTLAAGRQANSVVSIFGSASNDGDAVAVVSIFGNTRVSGPVRDSAVSVFGNSYIDGNVAGDTVAVFGNVDLGPHAEVDGDVIAVLGTVRRDPGAIVHGDVNSLFGNASGGFDGLRAWVDHALLFGRPLALHPGLGWAWEFALGFLVLYAGIALLFSNATSRCVQTLEMHPGPTLLAAIIAMLSAPVLFILLCITLVGIAAVPFVGAAFLCAWLFGKAVTLAWLGARITGRPAAGPLSHPAVAVLIGGAVVMALYLVPVLGFLTFQLLGIFGFGAVVYTLVLATRAHQAAKLTQNDRGTGSDSAAPFQASVPPAGSASPAQAVPPLAAHASAAMPRAGFWIRMGALLLDAILVGFVMGVLHHGGHIHLLVLALYGAVMWKVRGSTVGGIIFDLRVVRLDGRDVDWETAIIRALGCFLSLAVAGLGFIWIAIDDSNQAWHDKIAGTVVVRVPKTVPLPA